jgi:hypothetical protein
MPARIKIRFDASDIIFALGNNFGRIASNKRALTITTAGAMLGEES